MVVRLAGSGEQADSVVTLVGDQVLEATAADVGKVVTVAADGSLVLAAGGADGVTDHGDLDGLSDDDHPYVLESLVDAAGDLLVGTGADTVGRLAMGSTPLKVLRRNAGGTALEWSTLPGTLIGLTEYDPAGDQAVSMAATAFADVDATNLAVTFVVPESGIVIVRLSAAAGVNTGGHSMQWGLREGGADVAGSEVFVTSLSTALLGVTRAKRFSGLTPGTSTTWKWAQRNATAATTVTTRYGGQFGPAIMEVIAG